MTLEEDLKLPVAIEEAARHTYQFAYRSTFDVSNSRQKGSLQKTEVNYEHENPRRRQR